MSNSQLTDDNLCIQELQGSISIVSNGQGVIRGICSIYHGGYYDSHDIITNQNSQGEFLVFIMGGILTMTADSHDIFTNQSLQGEFLVFIIGGILKMKADSNYIITNKSLQGEFFIIYPGDS